MKRNVPTRAVPYPSPAGWAPGCFASHRQRHVVVYGDLGAGRSDGAGGGEGGRAHGEVLHHGGGRRLPQHGGGGGGGGQLGRAVAAGQAVPLRLPLLVRLRALLPDQLLLPLQLLQLPLVLLGQVPAPPPPGCAPTGLSLLQGARVTQPTRLQSHFLSVDAVPFTTAVHCL